MKQSIFRKSFIEKGSERTITGSVVVTLNFQQKPITYNHPNTHDDVTKQVPVHKIEVFIDDKLIGHGPMNPFISSDEDQILKESEQRIKIVQQEIKDRSNEKSTESFNDRMTQLFA